MKRIPSNGQGLVIYREPNLVVLTFWSSLVQGARVARGLLLAGQKVISIDTSIVGQKQQQCAHLQRCFRQREIKMEMRLSIVVRSMGAPFISQIGNDHVRDDSAAVLDSGAPPLAPSIALFRQRLRDVSSLQKAESGSERCSLLNESTRTSALVTMRSLPLTTQWVRCKGSETAPG